MWHASTGYLSVKLVSTNCIFCTAKKFAKYKQEKTCILFIFDQHQQIYTLFWPEIYAQEFNNSRYFKSEEIKWKRKTQYLLQINSFMFEGKIKDKAIFQGWESCKKVSLLFCIVLKGPKRWKRNWRIKCSFYPRS